ncbi:MAG: molybdopterin molybdotransferase MoeA [Anaerolineae bacterium]|nr:molybdopterin molybdotransferase MoeA [Anaerolineae bacterium]
MTELFDVHTPSDAWHKFTNQFQPAPRVERIAVIDSLDRVLAAPLTAPHDLPSFPRSTVDGYAVAAQDTYGASEGLPALLDVVSEVAMGAPASVPLDEAQCALVHTGGMIPPDADAVVMVENTQRVGRKRKNGKGGKEGQHGETLVSLLSPVSLFPSFSPFSIEVYRPVAVGQNVIQVGEDVRRGDLVLPAGHQIRPQDIGGLLALGIVEINAAVAPRVAILSQGDEVVPPEQTPGPGQVRDINSSTLAALARRAGGVPVTFPIVPDRLEALQDAARRASAGCDMLVISAGSSVSYRDMTAQVIQGLGKPGILVHGVSVKPGKPTILAVCDGKPVFGLPGNPVSAMVIFDLFVAPAIRMLLGAQPVAKTEVPARLARNIASTTGREDYVQVRLETRDGDRWAVPVFGKSNLIYTLIRSDGVVRIPQDSNGIAQGSWVTVELH